MRMACLARVGRQGREGVQEGSEGEDQRERRDRVDAAKPRRLSLLRLQRGLVRHCRSCGPHRTTVRACALWRSDQRLLWQRLCSDAMSPGYSTRLHVCTVFESRVDARLVSFVRSETLGAADALRHECVTVYLELTVRLYGPFRYLVVTIQTGWPFVWILVISVKFPT